MAKSLPTHTRLALVALAPAVIVASAAFAWHPASTSRPEDNAVTRHQSYCESEVRAKILDAQLGGTINFYRQFDDPETVEAVRLWDRGARVTNIEMFDRVDVPGRGWLVVYKGTDLRAHGGEARLTTDRR